MKLYQKLLLLVTLAVGVSAFQYGVNLYFDQRRHRYEETIRTLNTANELLLRAIILEKTFFNHPSDPVADQTEALIRRAADMIGGLSGEDLAAGPESGAEALLPLLSGYQETFGQLREKVDRFLTESDALNRELADFNAMAVEVVEQTRYEIGMAMINVEPVNQNLRSLDQNVKNTLLWLWQANLALKQDLILKKDPEAFRERLEAILENLGQARENAGILENFLFDDVYKTYLAAAKDLIDRLPEQIARIAEIRRDQEALSDALDGIRSAVVDQKNLILASSQAEMDRISRWLERTQHASFLILVLGLLAGGIALFISITRPLNRAIRDISGAARRTSEAAAQVTGMSRSVSESAGSQAAGLEEIAASMEELSVMGRETSELTRGAEDLMRQNIQMSGRSVQRVVDLSRRLNDIKKDSDQMAEIITSINGIAFQTNLLALNAAVEAARAGETGAGFMVVAESVRGLAGEAGDAAKKTADLLENTMAHVTRVAGDMEEMGTDFEGIIETATVLGEKTDAITHASLEQHRGIEQINVSANDIDRMTQQVASDAEEAAAVAGEMKTYAEHMMEIARRLEKMVARRRRPSSNHRRNHAHRPKRRH